MVAVQFTTTPSDTFFSCVSVNGARDNRSPFDGYFLGSVAYVTELQYQAVCGHIKMYLPLISVWVPMPGRPFTVTATPTMGAVVSDTDPRISFVAVSFCGAPCQAFANWGWKQLNSKRRKIPTFSSGNFDLIKRFELI